MFLHKTDKARAELRPGNRSLSQRERSLLLLADGTRSLENYKSVFDGEGYDLALKLIREGYLERRASSSSSLAAGTPPFRPSSTLPTGFEPTQPPIIEDHVADTASPRSTYPSPETTQAIQAAADPFEGRRSLATTRMFLFGICERMFARRDPKLAEIFREALRQAKDRESMLAASHLLINEIEKVAGHDRADSISERIAMLLPSEQAA